MADHPAGGSQRVCVSAEPVVEDGLGPIGERQAGPLSALGNVGRAESKSCLASASRPRIAARLTPWYCARGTSR